MRRVYNSLMIRTKAYFVEWRNRMVTQRTLTQRNTVKTFFSVSYQKYMFFLYIFLFLKQMNNYPHKTTESVNESTTQCPNLNLTKIKLNWIWGVNHRPGTVPVEHRLWRSCKDWDGDSPETCGKTTTKICSLLFNFASVCYSKKWQ